MRDKTKNIISIILPLTTVFIIAFLVKTQPTGLAVYKNKTLYNVEGSVSITLQEKIPLDSYIRINIDEYEIKMPLVEFLKMSENFQEYKVPVEQEKNYRIIEEDSKKYIIGNGTYTVDLASLGIDEGFEKGEHTIKTQIVYEDSLLNSYYEIFKV